MYEPRQRIEPLAMPHFAFARRPPPIPASALLIDEQDIADLAIDHARIHRICAVLEATALEVSGHEVAGNRSRLSDEARIEIAREIEMAFDRRIRVVDSVLSRLFGTSPESFEDSILAKLLRRQIHDALDAKDLSESMINGKDPARLGKMLIEMRESVQRTLHCEVLALLLLLGDRLTIRARRSLEHMLIF